MDHVWHQFVALLKQHDLPISPAETVDALQSLAYVGIADRETVRIVLCSALIKDARDIALFDELFDAFFAVPTDSSQGLATRLDGDEIDHLPAEASATAAPEYAPDLVADDQVKLDLNRLVENVTLANDPDLLDLPALYQQLMLSRKNLQQIIQQVYHLHLQRAPSGAPPGRLNPGQIDGSPLETMLDSLSLLDDDTDLLDQLNWPELEEAQTLKADTNATRRKLALHRQVARRHATQKPAYTYGFTPDERRQMEEIIRRLARQMRGALSHRRTTDRSGRINIPRTIRNSMKYDFIPFYPVMASRRDERPRLVIICDVSLSVRNTARFMLHLLYSLQSLFERVRSFIFVSDLAEVSSHFDRLSIDEAIGMVFSGEVIDPDASSNYGHALELFHRQHLTAVTRRTTVIIMGDGRGNRNPPNAWILEELRQRCKQLIWLTPESRGSWQLAGSDMPTYAPICHRVEVVRNLDQLGKVTESLVRAMGA